MVAKSDQPLNPKDHVEKLQSHLHDLSQLSREVHHAPFEQQHADQKAAMKANDATKGTPDSTVKISDAPKTKGVDLSQAKIDQFGHVISGTIKLPGGDSYTSQDGKTWYWNTTKNGEPRQFKITGMKDAVMSSDGKFTMKFADGRRHEIDKDGKYQEFNNTVRIAYKDGRSAEYFNQDEMANTVPAGSIREDREHDHYGFITKIDSSDESGLITRTTFSYDENDQLNGMREEDMKTHEVKLRQKKDGEWFYVDEKGNILESTDDNGQKSASRIPMDFRLDQQTGELAAFHSDNWDIDLASGTTKGWLSQKFEVGKGSPEALAGKVNIDPNHASGYDYGPWQMNYRAGTPQRFTAWTKSHAPDIYEKLGPHTDSVNQGLDGEFGQAWKQVAHEDGAKFLELQRQFMLTSYLGPLLNGFGSRLKNNGLLQEHAYAMSVQFGPAGASRLMRRAGALDSSVSNEEYTKNLIAEASSAYPKNRRRYEKEGRIVLDNLT